MFCKLLHHALKYQSIEVLQAALSLCASLYECAHLDTSAWGGRSAMCGSDLAGAYVFTGVHVFGTAPVCIWHMCVCGPEVCTFTRMFACACVSACGIHMCPLL